MGPGMRGQACALALCVMTQLVPASADNGRVADGTDEVRLPSVAIGKTYSTWRLAQAPVVVRNAGDDTVRVHVEIIVPARHEVRAGALPVPDRSWIQVVKSTLVLPPHSAQRTDVRLTLPYDPDLAGHTYQVDLWSGELSANGTTSVVGQRHRILFTVEMDYRDDTEVDFAGRAGARHARSS